MEELVLFILTLVLVVLFIYFNSKKVIKKAQTKLDIVNSYKNSLLKILKENENDIDLQIKSKIEFLKKVNQELSMNIFFDKGEAKIILEELSKMECK